MDKLNLIGKEIPQADGTDAGVLVLDYDTETNDYVVEPIVWSTGRSAGGFIFDIDAFKITYRYCIDEARDRTV